MPDAHKTISKDGIAGEQVRVFVDLFRECLDERLDAIEEVTVSVEAKDDFGLKDVSLHYSVNGGAEKVVPMLEGAGAKNSTRSTVISLEDFKVQPGDVVSLYATAKDARKSVSTDMFFIEAQPFERNYTQSQEAGGGGGGGDDDAGDQDERCNRAEEASGHDHSAFHRLTT